MSVTDEQLVEGVVELREQEVGRDPRGVDEVISGGQRRVRRRRAAAIVPALGLTLVGSGLALALLGTGGDSQSAPPASTSSPTSSATSAPFAGWRGCTLRPESCDGTVVEGWFADHVDDFRATGDLAFRDAATTSQFEGFPPGTRWFTTAQMESVVDSDQPIDQMVLPPQVDVYVAAKGSGNRFWVAEPITAADRARERRVEVRPGLDARVIQGEGSAVWSVLEGPGHGAVYLTVKDQSGGGGKSLTDDDVVGLLRFLLEDPEVAVG